MTRRTVENERRQCSPGVEPPMTSMSPPKVESPLTQDASRASGTRPSLNSQHSNSLPTTPYQRPRELSSASRSPSPGRMRKVSSPRSSHSDSNQSLPALRKTGGCKYETGMAKAKRRVPYSLGPDRLEPEKLPLKNHLTADEDAKLSGDMRELYDRLLPSPESETRRANLVQKLEKLLNERWPGHCIKVNVFGSTGNRLGSSDSDVDICITTDLKELERVCSIAELLAKHGMERVVCVSSAKVPIVKIWDPELRLACDMNVNNPLALENTEMIRTYVAIDDRVRPLAMIIKYWAKRRVLNDPALGSTLSSYTWICMIINFLQTRTPPILPSLQNQPHLKQRLMHGINVAFDKDVSRYGNFGAKNKEALGELLMQFFRYYGHELDFEESVVSVRLGRVIPKSEKGWHLLQDNRLCVEEPFNTSRNLGNTTDDTSMRGVHIELRRAFKLVSEGNLSECCAEYEHPLDEGKTFEKFISPESRPIVAQAPSQNVRGWRGRGGGRNPKPSNRGPSTRRTSNPAKSIHPSLRNYPYQMTSHEMQLHARQQQFLLHDQLYQQYQYLQAQEQELRLQLQQQALLSGRLVPSMTYPHIPFAAHASQDALFDETNRMRAETVNHPPLTAPVRQSRFGYASPYLPLAFPRLRGPTTNPSSPRLPTAVADLPRPSRNASLTDPLPNSSLRAHSQPARPIPSPLSFYPMTSTDTEGSENDQNAFLDGRPETPSYASYRSSAMSSSFSLNRKPSEYIGYYVGHSPPLQAEPQNSVVSPVPLYAGLAISNGGLSPRIYPQVTSQSGTGSSTTPELPLAPTQNGRVEAGGSVDYVSMPGNVQSPSRLGTKNSGPLVVNGSTPLNHKYIDKDANYQSNGTTFSGSNSDDLAFDTPTSSETHSQGLPEMIEPEPFIQAEAPTNNTGLDITLDRSAATHPAHENPTSVAKGGLESASSSIDSHVHSHSLSTSARLAPQLSPVREVPSPSHKTAFASVKLDQVQANGTVNKKGKGKLNQENLPPQRSWAQPDQVTATKASPELLAEPVNPFPGDVTMANGWQTQKKKKHKKAAKSESDINTVNAVGGNMTPLDASQRKGG